MKIERNSYINALDSIGMDIYHLSQKLEGVVHPDITKKLEAIYALCEKELKPIRKAEEKERKSNYDKLEKLQAENKLKSVWSMSIAASDLNQLTPPISQITYESWGTTQIHKFDQPTKITWLEFWKLADRMIIASGDTHHIFIESLYHRDDEPEDYFYLNTGS